MDSELCWVVLMVIFLFTRNEAAEWQYPLIRRLPTPQSQPQVPGVTVSQNLWQWPQKPLPQQPQTPAIAAPQRPWQWNPQQQSQLPVTAAPQRPWQWTPPRQPQMPVTAAPLRPWLWTPPQQQPQIPVTAAPYRPWQWTPQQQPQIPVTAAPQRPWQWTPAQQPQMPLTAAPQKSWQWTPSRLQQQPQIPVTAAPQRPWQWNPQQQPQSPVTAPQRPWQWNPQQQPQIPATAAPQRPWQWNPQQQPQSPVTAAPPRPPQRSPSHVPHHPQKPQTPGVFQKCEVKEEDRVNCGTPDVTAGRCEAINCCFDGQQCYYGKAVTVQCTRDAQFVVVVARDATLPPLDVESVSLQQRNEPSCRPAGTTSAFVVFQFPVTACGTIMTEEKGFVVYENHLSSSYEVGNGPRGSITRDSQFDLLFQCRYSATAVEVLLVEIHPVPPPHPVALQGPLRVELRLANGQCHSKGCADEEEAYTSYYTAADYPVTKALREPVYAEVRILGRTDPNIVLTLEHCWATAGPNPDNNPQWDLLVNGCPYRDDRYLTAVVPVEESAGLAFPTHHKRFAIKMFTFVDSESFSPLKETVFIHCRAAVCHPSATTSCVQTCHRQRRDVSFKSDRKYDTIVSSGEVILTKS